MWFFGHASLGYLILKIILRRKNPNKTIKLAGILAGMLPDGDVILLFWSRQAFFKYHRAFTHSLVFCLVTAVLLYIFLCSSCSKKVFQAFFIAGLSHLISDAFTDSDYPHGVALLWPFSGRLFSFKILDHVLGFGFVTSRYGSFILSVIISIIAIILTFTFLKDEKSQVIPSLS